MDENMDNQSPPPDNQSQSEGQPQPETPGSQAPPPPPQPEPGPVGAQTPPVVGEPDKDARMWGMFCHLAGLAAYLPILPFPIGNVIGPLIIWMIKKDEMPFVDDQGKESLNFQISMSIYGLICIPLICLAGLGAILAGVVLIVDTVFIIIAAIAANDGKAYRYPLTIRMIK